MNKTVYLRDDEAPIWEKARELADDKLSPIIVSGLRRFIAEKEALGKGFERIELKFNDSDDNNIPRIKAFYGRWIFNTDEPLTLQYPGRKEVLTFAIAETAKGNVVVYTYKEDAKDAWAHKMRIYPGFEEAADDKYVHDAILHAIEKRGIPVEELDI